jgi:hypothetical protein
MRWKVRLTGVESGLEDLSDSFTDDPEVFEDDGNYFLWSSRFEDLDEASDVQGSAERIVRLIRNFGAQDSLWVEELAASHIHEILNDGTELVSVFAEGETVKMSAGPARATSTSEDGTGETCFPADQTYEWTQLALEDEKVEEVVDLLDRGDDWVNLYRIYELIQDNIEGDQNIVDRSWWSSGEENQFTRTANSRDAIGDDARHGDEQTGSPSDPMTHQEAKRLIDTLIDNWLRHRKNL